MKLFALALLIPLSCTAQGAAGQCDVHAMQVLVGKDTTFLETMRLTNPVRVLNLGDAVTEDYSPDRLNVELDEQGIISQIWCG